MSNRNNKKSKYVNESITTRYNETSTRNNEKLHCCTFKREANLF